jgi:hypothetical protein
MGVKRVSKYCKTLRSAVAYRSIIYRVYHSVKLVSFPRFSEAGTYVWEVSNDNK